MENSIYCGTTLTKPELALHQVGSHQGQVCLEADCNDSLKQFTRLV